MKLQHLSVIFIIIMLPISLIISAYTQAQIDTLVLLNSYDAKLMYASYDAIKAFDINTMNNDLSNVADTVRDDINAAISTFMTSFSASMGVPGGTDRYIKPYVPAMLFTLYDGYYIYAPTLTENNGFAYTLQPYNYYSVRYYIDSDNDIVVNYTLDNYIVVYGKIHGKYQVNSGYLIADDNILVGEENTIEEYVPVANINNNVVEIDKRNVADQKYSKPVTSESDGEYLYESNDSYYIAYNSAQEYYTKAKEFTNWVNENLNGIEVGHARRNGKEIPEFQGDNTKIFDIGPSNNPEDINSRFNQHRMEVIKNSIQDNLNYSISAYAASAGANEETKYNFRLPQINPDEWVTISSNICMVAFVQGMPVGTRYYNNYSIVQSTTNKFFVDPENIYYIQEGGDGCYHKIDCPNLKEDGGTITGFSNYNFQKFTVKISNGGETTKQTYYRHDEGACYYCIVGDTYRLSNEYNSNLRDEYGNLQVNKLSNNKKDAYYKAIGREKYNQYTTTNYFGEKNKQEG